GGSHLQGRDERARDGSRGGHRATSPQPARSRCHPRRPQIRRFRVSGLNWFQVRNSDSYDFGATLDITGTGVGFARALAHAHDALASPHAPVSSDLLWAECNELADLMVKITAEDGHARSLGAVLRALMLEVAKR